MSAMLQTLQHLAAADGWMSGTALADRLGVSRNAVHKHIHAAIAAGWPIQTAQGQGYRAEFVDVLDAAVIADQAGLSVTVTHQTQSTNDDVLGTPFCGARAHLAEQQTGGRGRRGRRWESPPGQNLYLSLDWQFEQLRAPISALGIAVAVSVVRAVALDALHIKWPNDLQDAHGRKVGGILIDAAGEAGGPMRAVIGIGLNVHQHIDLAVDQPWGSLADVAVAQHLMPPDRNQLAARLLQCLQDDLSTFANAGLAPFRAAFESRHVLRGQAVTIEEGGRRFAAADAKLADDGSLQVTRDDGKTVRVYAADVSVRAA